MGTLDQQDVKAGCALGNGLHHIIQQRPCEAQTPRRNKAQIKISIFFPQGKKEGYDFQKVSSWRGGKPNSFVSTALSEIVKMLTSLGFPGGTSGEEPTCQCRRCKRWEFDP